MTELIQKITELIDECSDEDRRALRRYLRKLSPHPLENEWDIDADTILSAIDRSSDLTKRGVRGIIAEAVFVSEILPTVLDRGWRPVDFEGDQSYDAKLQKDDKSVRIQVKLQRLEDGEPKLYYPKHYKRGSLYVVEVQKTRTGKKTARIALPATDTTLTATESVIVQTRPYSFGDFDILAVNMHPSTKDWRSFRYTIASWLLPRRKDEKLIEIFQPVSASSDDVWTDDLQTCLEWFESGIHRRVLTELLHIRKPKDA